LEDAVVVVPAGTGCLVRVPEPPDKDSPVAMVVLDRHPIVRVVAVAVLARSASQAEVAIRVRALGSVGPVRSPASRARPYNVVAVVVDRQ
jgi:hypothetical protein